MKVVAWKEWDDDFDAEWFKTHHTAHQYTDEQVKCVAEAARSAGYKFPGEYHQNGPHGVPYFDDGTPFMVTQRQWGSIMALAWPEIINKWCENPQIPLRKDHKNTYIAFAWHSDELENIYSYPT